MIVVDFYVKLKYNRLYQIKGNSMNDSIIWVRWYMDYGHSGIPEEFEYEWYDRGLGQLESKFSEITEDLEERYGHLYNESEHCRGIKWVFVDRPPKKYIDERIEYYRRQLLWDQRMFNMLEGVYE